MSKKIIITIIGVIAISAAGWIFLNFDESPEDRVLFSMISGETVYMWYKNDSAIVPTSEETERAHDNFMRIRFNQKASSVLDASGKLPEGKTFPDSSIIVKEIFSDKSKPAELLAVMVKMKDDNNAGKDWLWAEYTPAGETEYSVNKKGGVCIKCHTPGDDYVRIFDIR